MHKSGTSLLAEILHKSGIKMYDTYRQSDRPKYEDFGGRLLNLSMIESGFDNRICFTNDKKKELTAITSTLYLMTYNYVVRRDNEGKDWGFKDPHTLENWNIWEIILNNFEYKLIGIYRNPKSVLHHLRDKIASEEDKISRWKLYNNALADIMENTEKDYILIDYDELVSNDNIEPLEKFIGKELVNIIDASKRHHTTDNMIDECKDIWHRLEVLNNYR